MTFAEVFVTVIGGLVALIGTLVLVNINQLRRRLEDVKDFAERGIAEAKDAASHAHQRLDQHEERQAEIVRTIDSELADLKGNYTNRFNQVNENILKLKTEIVSVIGELKIALAQSGVKFSNGNGG